MRPITDEMVMAATKASHEAQRELEADDDVLTWDECVADPTCWGDENFTLDEVLGITRAGLEAARKLEEATAA